ncbi:MAG: hypothetical protein M1820_005900 [Bogoriella megaspora]|nr:MAG: hypothetical protein M1820_005900 [Bogoriella megaspora]
MSEAAGNGGHPALTKRKITRIFSNDESNLQPNTSSKRQRVSKACDQCRNTRAKCDGQQPTCKTCASAHKTCTFAAIPKKRGVQAGYVRSLELTLAWLLKNKSGVDEALEHLLRQRNGNGRALVTGQNTAESDSLYEQWRQSPVAKVLEMLLSGSDIPEDVWEKPNEKDEASNERFGLHSEEPTASGPADDAFMYVTSSIQSGSIDAYGEEPQEQQPLNTAALENEQPSELGTAGLIRPILHPGNMAWNEIHAYHERRQDPTAFVTNSRMGDFRIVNDTISQYPQISAPTSYGQLQNPTGDGQPLMHQSAISVPIGTAGTSQTDLNFLLDDFMDADSAHGLELEPQFMQNLGFGPDFTSTDALYEQLDPLNLAAVTSTDMQSFFADS